MPLLSSDLAARLNRWPRRLAALACLLLAAGSALASRHRPAAVAAPPGTSVVVAARAIPVGLVLSRGDLTVARWPPALVPATSVADPSRLVGKRVAGPVGRGEAVTTTRLVGADLIVGLPADELAVPVTVADPNSAALVRVGDFVDLISVPDEGIDGAATAVPKPVIAASGVRVLAVLPARVGLDEAGGVGLIVAADHADALRIAGLVARRMLAVRHQPP